MTKEIQLSQGMVAIVDDEDFEWLSQYVYYYVSSTGYARRVDGYSRKYMHRDITKCPDDLHVDHINGNRLDNRRENLRIVTVSQNHMNRIRLPISKTSIYRGVSAYTMRGMWQAQIHKSGKILHFGHFKDEAEAALVYDIACRILFGEYGRPNFSDDEYNDLRSAYPQTVAKTELKVRYWLNQLRS